MRGAIIVALIASFPPTLAAVLGYQASGRSLRRTVGEPATLPLSQVVQRLDQKLDELVEGQADIRERLVRLETQRHQHVLRGRT